MKFKLSQNKHEVVIAICFLIYIAIDIYLRNFFDIDLLHASDSLLFRHSIFKMIQFFSLMIAISGSIIFGIRSLRRDGFSVMRFISPAIGIFLCILTSGTSIYGNIMTKEMQETVFDNSKYHSLTQEYNLEELNQNLSLSQRSELSVSHAKFVWQMTGKAIKYIANDGNIITYSPSAEEIEERRLMLRANERLTESRNGMKRAGVICISLAFFSVGLGIFTPIRRKDDLGNLRNA